MQVKADVRKARVTIEQHKRLESISARLSVAEACPHTLHLEMRGNEKIFLSLFQKGNNQCEDGDGKTRNLFEARVTDAMNTMALGEQAAGGNAQWKMPFKKSKRKLNPRSMTKVTSGRCVVGIKMLAAITFSAELDQKSATPQQVAEIGRCNLNLLEQWVSIANNFTQLVDKP